MKQAHRRYGHSWFRVELTGVCKKVTGGPHFERRDIERHYYQVWRTIFGVRVGKYWVHKHNIEFFDPVEETIYECKCGEQK